MKPTGHTDFYFLYLHLKIEKMGGAFNLSRIKKILNSGSSGSILLLLAVISSLLIANSPLDQGFKEVLATKLGYESGQLHLNYSILLWINDGLMAIFFLFVGLELKRELVEGELSSVKQAILPVFAASGGALLPALIYLFFNSGTETANGWGIPMATDIAFTLAMLNVLGKKVPVSLKVFVTALAIVDDLMAIIVIAVFYSSGLEFSYLGIAGGIYVLMLILNKAGLRNIWFYLIPAIFLWYFIHHSGIHATIAGVLTAMAIPVKKINNKSPLETIEHAIAKPVSLIIIPLFALVNTNIRFTEEMVSGINSPLGLGIIAGLLVGKPIGILFFTWLSVKLKLCPKPSGAGYSQIFGVGILAGIGFTMSIFIAILSFDIPLLQDEAKFAILVGSLASAIIGYTLLRFLSKKNQPVSI